MSHRKNDNLDFEFLNPVQDSSSYVYYSTEPAFPHPYAGEATQTTYSHYGDYQHPFQNAKPDNQYSPAPLNMFASESFDSGSKGYSRTISDNDLLTENSVPCSRTLRRFNSDIPSYYDYGTYNPFQGSPLEIANLSLLENRPVDEQVQSTSQTSYESELVQEEHVEAVQNKRTYKDVLTFPTRSESPGSIEAPKKGKMENELRKETYKERLLSSTNKVEVPLNLSKPNTTPSVKPLNNHQSQVSVNPKRPLKINNDLASGSINKGNMKSPSEKNWHSVNESVRSVRSQTDLGGIKKKNRPSLIDSPSFELPPSDDEFVTPIEVRTKDLKKNEKTKVKARDKDNEKSNRRHNKRNAPHSVSATLARAYFPKVFPPFF